jgi:uncharacterized repeat protein (TIGR01451 family)
LKGDLPVARAVRAGSSQRLLVAAVVGSLLLTLVYAVRAPSVRAAIDPGAGCTATTLSANDDGSTGIVPLGFTANFFGNSYTSLYVNNNGNVTFTAPLSEFTAEPLVTSGIPIIAPFWADVDTRDPGSSEVKYGPTTFGGRPAFCVNWDGVGVGYFALHVDKLNKFQLLLVDRSDVNPGDFDIVFNYDQVQWETGDASGGSGGLGGSSARAGYTNGTSPTSFEMAGSAVNGAFLDSNVDSGLIHYSRNSAVPGRYIFEVRNGSPDVSADLAITSFSDSPDPVTATKPIRYTIDVANNGPDTANNVRVIQVLPAGSSFLGASDPSCAESEGQVDCNLGTLAAEGSTTLTIDVAAPSTAGSVVSFVYVVADEPDPNSDNDSAEETTTVQNPSAAPDDGSGFATGQGATTISTSSSDPVQFSRITVPAGVVGEVRMHEETEAVCPLVVGVRCIGERLDLDAPDASANNPLVLEIFVGKAAAGKINPKKPPVLYHAADGINYLPVPPCAKKTHVANPAPSCVAPIKNATIGGIAFFVYTVYTMTNGSWRPGSPR